MKNKALLLLSLAGIGITLFFGTTACTNDSSPSAEQQPEIKTTGDFLDSLDTQKFAHLTKAYTPSAARSTASSPRTAAIAALMEETLAFVTPQYDRKQKEFALVSIAENPSGTLIAVNRVDVIKPQEAPFAFGLMLHMLRQNAMGQEMERHLASTATRASSRVLLTCVGGAHNEATQLLTVTAGNPSATAAFAKQAAAFVEMCLNGAQTADTKPATAATSAEDDAPSVTVAFF